MNYASWSELIYKYYFGNNSGTRVMFHITLQDLVDFAKEENVEIANRRYASEFNDDFIRRDFVSKFWSIPKDGNNDIKDFEKKILNLKKTAIEKRNYKELLTIVAVLIMPICENDELELHGNDYYGHLLPFLYVNKFIKSKENKTRDLLNTIRLDEIWNVINKWAASESLAFKSSQVVSENGTRHYARSLMKESLLSPSRLQKFCIIFERAGLAPRVNIENDRLLSAFNNYHQYIGLSQIKYKQLTSKDFKGYLESILRQEYDNWDGSTKIKERDRKTGQSREESGNTYYPLLLLMKYDIHTKSIRFGFHLYCADIDDMEDMNFIIDDSKEILPSIYIKSDGYANKPFYLEETVINNILQNKNKVFGIHEINSETIKGRFIVTDYYLLKAHKNGYIATNEFIKGEFYFIILNNNTVESFTEWLEENSAELISEVIFGGLYSLYKIDCAVKEMPQRNNLRFKSEIRCKSTNNIEVKTADQSEIILLSKLFPAQFEITGVDVINDKIYAVSVNCEHRNSTELTYDHERSLWILNVFSNVFQLNKEFQLYCNEAPIPYGHTYKFSDFILPTSFKEVQLNEWGETKGEVFSSGLTLPDHIIKKIL